MTFPTTAARYPLLLAGALCLAAPTPRAAADDTVPLTAEQRKQLQESERLRGEVRQLEAQGQLAEAVAALRKALAVERRVLGDVHDTVADSLAWLASLYERQADFASALPARQEVLAIRTRLHGARHWRAVNAGVDLAFVQRLATFSPEQRRRLAEARRVDQKRRQLYDQRRYREAGVPAQEVLETYRQLLGEDDPLSADALNSLAMLYQAQGDLRRAEAFYRQAIAAQKKVYGDNHPNVGITLMNIGLLLGVRAGAHQRAEQDLRAAAAIFEAAYGPRDQLTVRAQTELAECYSRQALQATAKSDFTSARAAWQRNLELLTKLHGADSWQAQGTRLELADLDRLAALSPEQLRRHDEGEHHFGRAVQLHAAKKYEEAIESCRRALALRKEVFGDDHVAYANCLSLLAALYQEVGDFEQAQPAERRALEIYLHVLGEEHPKVATELHNLGLMSFHVGDFAAAEVRLRRAYEMQKKLAGPAEANTSRYLRDLIQAYQRQAHKEEEKEEFAAAARSWHEVVSLKKRLAGMSPSEVTDARLTADRMERLAQFDAAQRSRLTEASRALRKVAAFDSAGKYREALEPCQKALRIAQELLGEADRQVADTLAWLGHLYMCLKDDVRAEAPYRRAAEIYQELLGDAHPSAVRTLKALADLNTRLAKGYAGKGEYEAAGKAWLAVAEFQSRLYGPGHWKVVDARLMRQLLEESARLSTPQRDRLKQAQVLVRQKAELVKQHKYTEALPPAQEALAIYREVLGEGHAAVANSLADVGFLHFKAGDFERARPLLLQGQEALARLLGEHHPEYLAALYNVAALEQATGHDEKAEAIFRRALTLTRELGGGEPEAPFDWAFNGLVSGYEARAVKAENDKEWATARGARERVVALVTYRFGPGHWRVTDARLALDDTDRRARLSPEQHQRLQEASKLTKKEGELASLGQNREALAVARQALALCEEVLGAQNKACVSWLYRIGDHLLSAGDSSLAEQSYRKALAIQKDLVGQAHPQYAAGLCSLAQLYRSRDEYAKAEPLYQQALDIHRRVFGPTDTNTASNIYLLGSLYWDMGRFDQAKPLLLQAVELTRKTPGETHALALFVLASTYQRMNDPARAELVYQEAVQLCRNNRDVSRDTFAYGLEGLASLYEDLGETDKMEAVFQEVLEIHKKLYGEDSREYANSLVDLAGVYLRRRDPGRAEPLVKKALEICRKSCGEHHVYYAKAQAQLAKVCLLRRDWDQAESLYRKSWEIIRKARGEISYEDLNALANLAAVYDGRGDWARAASYYRQCLDLQRRQWELAVAGRSDRQQLSLAEASRTDLTFYLSAAWRAGLSGEETYAQVLAWKGAVLDSQRWRRELQHVLQERNPQVAALYTELQSVTARLAALAFAGPEGQASADRQRQLRELTDRKETLEGELARRSALLRKRKQEEGLSVKQLRESLPEEAVLIDLLEYAHGTPPKEGQKDWSFEWRVAAFVVRPDAVVRVELGAVAPIREAVDQWRLALQRRFLTEGDARRGAAVRRLVWEPLEEHLRGARTVLVCPDGALARIPFAALPGSKPGHYLIEELAVAVIPVPRLLPELVASPAAAKARPDASLLLLGDVDFGTSEAPSEERGSDSGRPVDRGETLTGWQSLAGTREEIVAVRQAFEQRFSGGHVRLLRGERATKDAFRRQAPQAQWLHLATHGFFAPPQLRSALAPQARPNGTTTPAPDLFARQGVSGFLPGLLSGLVLAGANRPVEPGQDSGILTAQEVEALDLSGVELAVLSACETGLGEVAGGEGLLGLQRAFQVAGARSAVAGLWQVDDAATRKLMEQFYTNLWDRKLPKLEALRQAQLWMLKEGDAWMRQEGISRGVTAVRVPKERLPVEDGRLPPYYWAAFTLSGDWR